jgi:PAS domain S-box-containing protein
MTISSKTTNNKYLDQLEQKTKELQQEIAERKQAEILLNQHLEFIKLISEISSDFINLETAKIDDAINKALELVTRFTGVERGYVFLLTKDEKKLELTHEWCIEDVLAHKGILESINVSDFEDFVNSLKRGETAEVHTADIPRTPENKSMTDVLDLLAIKSFINLPIIISNKFIGYIGFDATRKQTEWSEGAVNTFNLIGEIIGNTLERKRAEEALRESEERLRSTISSMDDLVFVLDKNGVFLDYYQPAINSDLFVPPELFLGKSFKKVNLPPDVVKSFEKAINAVTAAGMVHKVDYSLEMAAEKKWFSAKVSMRKDSFGEFDGVTVVARNITEQKVLQERMVRQEKLAVLGQLAGGVGHELRNPLNAIKNAVYFLKMALENPEPEVKETLEVLEKEVDTSGRIINSLLDFARNRPPQQREVDINHIIRYSLSHLNIPKNIRMKNQIDESLPAIPADADQLGQAFGNIMLNAIQAMPEGGRLIIKSGLASPGWVTVSFADTGIGIAKEDLGKIFEPLITGKARGIGLGMAITKTFVEGHGGTIEVQSETGKGSTFTVKLPGHKKEK